MADKIHIQILTSGGTVFADHVPGLNVPVDGATIGILANHAPLLGAVTDGVVRCTYSDGHEACVAVGIGVLNVVDNEVTLLVRAAEKGDDIDLARAEAAERRARERLANRTADIDVSRAEAALHRAIARQDAARMVKKHR
jgi:F-type H+-transporting ATPase subunit epsilon